VLESKIQSKITDYLTKNRFYSNKILSASRNGFPDVLAVKNGNVYLFEVKQPGEELKPLQEITIKKLNEHKEIAFCVQSFDQFLIIWRKLE